ncbi:uncharacterized protein [Littorina saxatilis]|uniref:uncharacterized protein n=1 Tax=Littorina saxatilis TaxID=31220 RepID=UPI0038B47D21
MSLFGISFIFSISSVMVYVVQADANCAIFMTNTQLVPDGNGYIVTLTFSVINDCGTALQSIKLANETEGHLLNIICKIGFENGSADVSRGCTHDVQSHTFSATGHVDKGEIWTLFGRLRNGDRFIQPVVMSLQSVPMDVTVPATVASVLLTIAIILIVILYWLRKKTRGVSNERSGQLSGQPSGQPSLSQEDPYYLHLIHLPEDVPDSHPANTETRPKRFYTYAAEDEDGYTLPNITRPTDGGACDGVLFRQVFSF